MSDELRNEQEIEVCEQEEVVTEEAAQEQEVTETPEEPAKKGGKKWLIAVIAAVLAVAVAVAVGVGIWLSGSKQPQEENAAAELSVGKLFHYYEGGMSFDGKTTVYEQDGDLYLKTEDEEIRIAEDAQMITSSYSREMAGSGKALIYEKEEALYYYNCETAETTKVADAFFAANISTNGEYVVYIVEDESIYLWDGENKKLDDGDYKICSVSDDGVVYTVGIGEGGVAAYENDEGEPVYISLFSFTKDGTKTVVKDGVDNIGRDFPKNRTQNQVLFVAYEDEETANLYVSIDGKPAQKILSDIGGSFPNPELAFSKLPGAYNWLYSGVFDIDDLRGQIYATRMPMEEAYRMSGRVGESALIYIHDDWSAEVVLNYSEYRTDMFYERTTNNQYIYAKYMDEEHARALYRIDVETGEATKLLEDVFWFSSAGDGSVYYTDDDQILWHLSGDQTEKVAENIERGYIGTDDGGVLYYGDDGKLWLKKPGKNAELIAEDVTWLRRNGKEFIYERNETDKYYSTDGRNFELR